MLDIDQHYGLIRRTFYGRFGSKVRAKGMDPEDVLQEVLLGLVVRNQGSRPYDPMLSAPATYIFLVCKSVVSNVLDKRRRKWWEATAEEEDASTSVVEQTCGFNIGDVAGVADRMGLDTATIEGILDGEYTADEVLGWLADEGSSKDDDYLMFLPLFGSGGD